MSLTGKLKRFDLIISKLERNPYATLESLLTYLSNNNHTVSARTLQRDFEELQAEFKIFIEYDFSRRGYFIEKDLHADSVIQFIKNMSLQANFLEFTKDNKSSDAIILKENYNLKGVEYIPQLLAAIKNTFQIQLMYQQFGSDKPKRYTLLPYALKEYNGRWYLVGTSKNHTSLIKFGVDRILDLEPTETKFKRNKSIDLETYFSRMIGITDDDTARETVVLSFTPSQAKYIETLPLHWSQELISTTDKEVIFQYFLIINYELKQRILSYGDQIKVLQPKKLVVEHKKSLKNALKQY